MNRTKINKVYVVGEITEVKTQVRETADGRKYINGSFVVSTEVSGEKTLVEFKILAFEKTKAGVENKMFTSYCALDGMLNKKVRVSGELRDENMITSDGKVIHFNGVYAKFINQAKAEDVECATFEYSGFVAKALYERRTAEDKLLGYKIEVAQANYNDTAMQVIRFDVKPEDVNIQQAIEQNYLVGSTVKFGGTLSFVNRVETKTEPVSFGEPIVKTYTVSDKTYRITSGNEAFDEDSADAYSIDEIKKFVADYKLADAARLEAAKGSEDNTEKEEAANAMKKITRSNSLI